jgi:hypothetical protein
MKGEKTVSKHTREFFEQLKAGEEKSRGIMDAFLKDGIPGMVPGLSLSKILSDIGHELKEQIQHGAHELASALFTGNGYVQYARKDKVDSPDHGQPEQQQEQSHGGREM